VTSKDTAPKRAVIYARISRDNKQGSGLGVGKQADDCRALAAQRGLEVIEPVREDNDLTAFKGGSRSKSRPGYKDLLGDIRSGRADVVLAWHTDRLHRDMTELEEYITVCGEGRDGVPTYTVQGGDLDLSTSSGRMVARILGAVARGEVEHMIERMQSAHERIRNAGGWKGGPRPFGYRLDGPSIKHGGEGKLAQVPGEAAAIRDGCAKVLAGIGPHPIAKQWNGAGLLTTAGKPWNNVNVRLALIRALNAGLIEYGTGKDGKGQGTVVGPGNWEPIVDEDTWRAVRAALTDPGRRVGPGPKPRHLLTGVLVCGICGGHTFRVIPSKWGSLYQCNSHAHRPAGEAGPRRWHLARKQQPLDDFVEQIVIERLSRPDVVAALNTRPEVDLPALDRRRTVINAELEEWARTPGITPRQLQITSGPLLDELAEVERQISEGLRGDPLPEFAGKDPAKVWAELKAAGNIERMRAVVAMLLRVRLLPVGKGGSRRGKRLVNGRVPFDDDTVEILPPDA
jgi:site-specific DNA recombinase